MKPVTWRAKPTAAYLNISYYTLLEMVKRGEIPHIRAGRLILFRKETLDQWLMEQEQQSIGG